MGDLETLKAVAALGLATDDIENLVDKLSTLSVMTLGPVVAGTGLAEDEVVGAEELAEGTGTDGVHGTGLEIDENGTGNILVAGSLNQAALAKPAIHHEGFGGSRTHLVEVDVHALELELGGAVVTTQAVSDMWRVKRNQ